MNTNQVLLHGRAVAAVGLTLVALSGCARESEPARTNGRAPFQAEIPAAAADESGRDERSQIARPPTRERKLCEALSRSADMRLTATANGVMIRLNPADGLRADALGAARELTRALHWPAEYAAEREEADTGCGVVELGREVAMAEVREVSGGPDGDTVWFELHAVAWPGREDLLRGRARIFIDEAE
jgi:hypothetical protein